MILRYEDAFKKIKELVKLEDFNLSENFISLTKEMKETLLQVLDCSPIFLMMLPENISNSPEVLEKVISKKSGFNVVLESKKLGLIGEMVSTDEEYQRIFNLNPDLANHLPVPVHFFNNKDNALKFVNDNALNLKLLHKFQNDKDVVSAAIEKIPLTISYAGDLIKNDKEFLISFFEKHSGVVGLQKSIPILNGFENDHTQSIQDFFAKQESENTKNNNKHLKIK